MEKNKEKNEMDKGFEEILFFFKCKVNKKRAMYHIFVIVL